MAVGFVVPEIRAELRKNRICLEKWRDRYSRSLALLSRLGSRLMSGGPSADKPVESAIRRKLTEQLAPIHLTILNESHMHNVPRDSETHFKVLVVSENFESLPLIKRHRIVNEILEHELKTGVHALSIMAKTPSQWDEKESTVPPSPACRGGFGK